MGGGQARWVRREYFEGMTHQRRVGNEGSLWRTLDVASGPLWVRVGSGRALARSTASPTIRMRGARPRIATRRSFAFHSDEIPKTI